MCMSVCIYSCIYIYVTTGYMYENEIQSIFLLLRKISDNPVRKKIRKKKTGIHK